MGQDDNLSAAIAHGILACVAAKGAGTGGTNYSQMGMHGNFLIHGILGILHYQSSVFNNDFAAPYGLSYKATKYLALPCLMADLYRSDKNLSVIHLLSGLVPFTLAVLGKDDPHLGHLVIACNTISLIIYSVQKKIDMGYFTAGAACLAYFVRPASHQIVYPLSLALLEHCAYRLIGVVQTPSIPGR